jgi:hypothetical protein
MIRFLGLLLAGILTFLALLHFYWGIKRITPGATVIPSDNDGRLLFRPSRLDSIIVGMVLTLFVTLVLIKSGWVTFSRLEWIADTGIWIIAGLFFLRAIGDFKYIGITKKIKTTAFARMDNRYYIPLCLIIAIIALIIGI